MPIRNYSSKISPQQSAGEIQQLVGEHGARRISLDYEAGKVVAVSFMMMIEGRALWFRIQPDPTGMLAAMKKDPGVPNASCKPEQAERTAWKNKLDWLDAQLAEVAAGQARIEQLMLGFAITDDGTTLYDRITSEGVLLQSSMPPALPPKRD